MSISPFDSFLAATDDLRARCGSVEIAASVMRRGDVWQILRARVVVWPWRQEAAVQDVVRLDVVRAMTRTTGAETLPSLIEGLRARQLRLPDWTRGEPPLLPGSPDEHRDWLDLRADRSRATNGVGVAWPAHTLVLQGAINYEDDGVRDAGALLVAADPPYLDWADLHADLGFGASFRDFSNRGSSISLSVVVPARLVEVTTTTKEIRALVEHRTAAGRTKLALVHRGAPRAERHLVTLDPHEGGEAASLMADVRFPPPGRRGLVDLVLSYDGWVCDRATTGISDGRAAVHARFDPGYAVLKARLDPEKRQADRFEEGVAWLLHDLGFAATRYGAKDVHAAPDVVAFADDEHVLVCECSVGLADPDMMNKVKHRAEEVERCLLDVGLRPHVVPVAVTALEQRSDPEDPSGWQAQGIALLTGSDLAAWTERALLGEGPAPFWEFVVARATPVPPEQRRFGTIGGLLPGLGG